MLRKNCTTCGECKPMSHFHRTGTGQYRRNVCRTCFNTKYRSKPVEKSCEHCGKLYPARNSQSRFCSKECRDESMAKQTAHEIAEALLAQNRAIVGLKIPPQPRGW